MVKLGDLPAAIAIGCSNGKSLKNYSAKGKIFPESTRMREPPSKGRDGNRRNITGVREAEGPNADPIIVMKVGASVMVLRKEPKAGTFLSG